MTRTVTFTADYSDFTTAGEIDRRVYRRVTSEDPSIYGEQYLGREGSMAWMPGPA